jgi:hypothetical protein
MLFHYPQKGEKLGAPQNFFDPLRYVPHRRWQLGHRKERAMEPAGKPFDLDRKLPGR